MREFERGVYHRDPYVRGRVMCLCVCFVGVCVSVCVVAVCGIGFGELTVWCCGA